MLAPAGLDAFHLEVEPGERFCLLHMPPAGMRPTAAFLYLHPFAEEMNKARRMAALQARRFAAGGIAVLQMDHFGCGDSAGEFAQANWEAWVDDARAALVWLRERTGIEPGLWGLRLGGLLAAELASSLPAVDRLLLWQPVASGETFLTQFLRMKVASAMLSGDPAAAATGTKDLRARLAAGESIEIGGYELSPALARAIDSRRLSASVPRARGVDWFEVVPDAARPLPPASVRVAEQWRSAGVDVRHVAVAGEHFWSSVEIAECPALLDATARAAGCP